MPNMTMTAREALQIQAEQLDFYCKRLNPDAAAELRSKIAIKTVLPENLDAPVYMGDLQIPRGADIEYAMGYSGNTDD